MRARKHSKSNNLVFIDQVVLSILADRRKDPPSAYELYHRHAITKEVMENGEKKKVPVGVEQISIVNDWLRRREVPTPLITHPISGNETISGITNKLQSLGLVNENLVPTPKGDRLLRDLGKNWRDWYTRLPLDEDGNVRFETGQSVRRILRAAV